MPRVFTEISDVYESITRPVALTAARQLASALRLPDGVKILYPGAAEEAAMTGSTLSYVGDHSVFKYDGRISLEVTETAVEDRVLATAIFRKENLPVFIDPILKVRITPVYSGTEMIINVIYRAPNRVLAKRFRDDALMHTAALRQQNMHELSYNYAFPKQYLLLLEELHRMREAVAGYGEDFSTWVRNHITNKATNLTTLIGTQPQLVIAENQISPYGWFDFNVQPEPETKENEGGPWNVSFEYHLFYDKVLGVTAEWPLVVHNQLVDELLRCSPNASGTLIDPDRRTRAPSFSRQAFDHFSSLKTFDTCRKAIAGFTIPEYDEWTPAIVHPDTSTLATFMLMVDETDPMAVVDLHELGDYQLSPAFLSFLTGESLFLNRYGESVVYLSLYREDQPIDDGSLVVSPSLFVVSANPLQLRERYHLRIALVNDLTILSPAAKLRLRNAGAVGQEILMLLQWITMGTAVTPPLIGGSLVSKQDFDAIAQSINNIKRTRRIGVEYRLLTVSNITIVTHRRSDYADHDTQANSAADNSAVSSAASRTPIPGCNS